jgi:uncharacterized SAM-binding protein YcdF (DUF218 family)
MEGMQVVKWGAILIAATIAVMVMLVVGVGFFLSPQDKLKSADVIVAISGGETQQRTAEAVRLYRGGYAPKLLFSGAAQDKNGPSNAAAMRSLAVRMGADAQDVLIEENSTNTAENATESAPIIRQLGAKRIILVTSPYHQRRASLNFRRALGQDIAIINHSSKDSSWRKSSWWTTAYTWQLTLSELQKTIYVYTTKPEAAQP